MPQLFKRHLIPEGHLPAGCNVEASSAVVDHLSVETVKLLCALHSAFDEMDPTRLGPDLGAVVKVQESIKEVISIPQYFMLFDGKYLVNLGGCHIPE